MSQHENILLTNYQLTAELNLKNRIVMAPMTRAHAKIAGVPTQQMADYYAKRADAGLIITEGTYISESATGYLHVPGIYTPEQLEGWRLVTQQVHRNDGKIFSQIWHVGRVSHPNFLGGVLPLSPSATEMKGRVSRTKDLFYGKSRAATLEEIEGLIQDFTLAAKNAMTAGFDGIELHGANGYLIDQFLHYDTNRRDDQYGQTPENMTRFLLDIVKSIGKEIGFDKIGIRLSPGTYLNEIVGDDRDYEVFVYLLETLNNFPIAYVHTGNFDDSKKFKELQDLTMTQFMRIHYKGSLIASGGYHFALAEKDISAQQYDLVAIGRPFIANPDLINLLKENKKLKPYDASMLNSLD